MVLENGAAGGCERLQAGGSDHRHRGGAVDAGHRAVVRHKVLGDGVHGFFRLLGEDGLDHGLVGEAVGEDFRGGEEHVVADVPQFIGHFHVGHEAAVEEDELVVPAAEGAAQVGQFHLGAVVFGEAFDHMGVGIVLEGVAGNAPLDRAFRLLVFRVGIVAGGQIARGVRPEDEAPPGGGPGFFGVVQHGGERLFGRGIGREGIFLDGLFHEDAFLVAAQADQGRGAVHEVVIDQDDLVGFFLAREPGTAKVLKVALAFLGQGIVAGKVDEQHLTVLFPGGEPVAGSDREQGRAQGCQQGGKAFHAAMI